MPVRLDDIEWAEALAGTVHPSPSSWADQVLYFLLLDRFSDGREDGYRDVNGDVVAGNTPPFKPEDEGNAVATVSDAERWRSAGATWVGGTLDGARTKLGYLKRLGVTALWIGPVLRQRPGTSDYHGYCIQNFLEVDPQFGSSGDLKRLVREAHDQGMYVILDVVLKSHRRRVRLRRRPVRHRRSVNRCSPPRPSLGRAPIPG
jgi:glycosidase